MGSRNVLLKSLIEDHLPATLRSREWLDRVEAKVPPAYLKCIVAASLASKIVYREGYASPKRSSHSSLLYQNPTEPYCILSFNIESEKYVLHFHIHWPRNLITTLNPVPPLDHIRIEPELVRSRLQYVEGLPESNLTEIALAYLSQEKKVHALVEYVDKSNLEPQKKADICDLLERGGVRAGVLTVEP